MSKTDPVCFPQVPGPLAADELLALLAPLGGAAGRQRGLFPKARKPVWLPWEGVLDSGWAHRSPPTLPFLYGLACQALLATPRRMSGEMGPQESISTWSPMSHAQAHQGPLSSRVMLGKLPQFSKAHSAVVLVFLLCQGGMRASTPQGIVRNY